MANLVVHFEIHASEPQRLIDFYGELFGWTFTQFGDMPYWAIDTGEGAIAAERARQRDQRRAHPAPRTGAGARCPSERVRLRHRRRRASVDELFQKGVDLGGAEALATGDMQGIGRVGYLLIPTATSSGSSRRSCPTAPT